MRLNAHSRSGDVIHNEDETLLRVYLRGRPIVLNIPSAVVDNYDVNEVAKPPAERLKLDWVKKQLFNI